MSDTPLVSVILPFYNNSQTVERAVRSMLRQTVTDIEVIAIDDGSADQGFAAVQSLRDRRVRLHRNARNRGVAATRNRALDLAQGRFVAMMDADDISHRKRLEWTLDALRAHPEAGVCGGWMRLYRRGIVPFILRQPCVSHGVRAMSLYGPPFCCASIMIRRDLVTQLGIRYDEALTTGEDDDFCARLIRHTQGMNIPRVVYQYRWNPRGLTAGAGSAGHTRRAESLRPGLEDLLGRQAMREELLLHTRIGTGAGARDAADLARRHGWLQSVLSMNASRRVFDAAALAQCSGMLWFRICRNSAHLGRIAWRAWRDSPLAEHYTPYADEWFGFAGSTLKCALLRGKAIPQGGGAD